MQSREHRGWLGLLAGVLLAAACDGASGDRGAAETAPASSWKPSAPVNLVLVLIDTLRADAILDPQGRYDTPNIDRLARDGVLFPRAFASAPMTLPSHVSLFSSRPPLETKVLNNNQPVPADVPLLAPWLAEHGYDTRAVISLATLDPPAPGAGVSRGFRSFDQAYWMMSPAEETARRLRASLDQREIGAPLFLFAHFADPHEPYTSHGAEDRRVQLRMDGEVLDELPASNWGQWSRSMVLTGGRTVFEFESLEKPPGKFRVRVFECRENGQPVPVTWEVGKEMDRLTTARVVVDRGEKPDATCEVKTWVNDVPGDPGKLQRYAAEVAYADRHVGELLDALDALGLYQDSLVVFTSDHGEALGEGRFFGHVERLTDVMIHVPLIVKPPRDDPRRAELERAAQGVVTHLDLAPTLLEIVGAPPLPGQRGRSLLEPHETVHIAETHQPEAEKNQMALRDARFKLVYFADEDRFEMYDLEADPAEKTDVFAALSGERADWPGRLRALYRESTVPADGAPDDGEIDPAMLKALGYGGGDEEEDR